MTNTTPPPGFVVCPTCEGTKRRHIGWSIGNKNGVKRHISKRCDCKTGYIPDPIRTAYYGTDPAAFVRECCVRPRDDERLRAWAQACKGIGDEWFSKYEPKSAGTAWHNDWNDPDSWIVLNMGAVQFDVRCQLLRSIFPPPWLCREKKCGACGGKGFKRYTRKDQPGPGPRIRVPCERCPTKTNGFFGTGKILTTPPFDSRWRTLAVLYVAQGIVNFKGNFDDMPILADALLDAGCDCEEMDAHCRSGGPWVRSDWLLGLILT